MIERDEHGNPLAIVIDGVRYVNGVITASLVKDALKGIDSDDYDYGWWETSTGVAFGKEKLLEILFIIVHGQRKRTIPKFEVHGEGERHAKG